MEEHSLTRELTKEELAEFRSAFDMFDIDGGGTFYILFGEGTTVCRFFCVMITRSAAFTFVWMTKTSAFF